MRLFVKHWIAVSLLAACGGGSRGSAVPASPSQITQDGDPIDKFALQPRIAAQTWYRAASICGQGPFELELPVGTAKYGEEVELVASTPRAIALHAVILVGDKELDTADGTFARGGRVGGKPDNTRCLADAKERLALGRAQRGGGGGGTLVTGTPGRTVVVAPPAETVTAELVPAAAVIDTFSVVHIRVPDEARLTGRVRIRFWSIEPNDLEGVVFGLAHVVWQPGVPDAEYEAHLALVEKTRADAEERDRLRREEYARAELARREEETRLAREKFEREAAERAKRPRVIITIDPEVARREREARERELAAERAREMAEAEAREKRRQADARSADERRREAALAAERRKQFCATHPDDRGCWGVGGLKVHLEFEAHVAERATYCAAHREDARCWTSEDKERVRADSQRRITASLTPVKPDGPPPAPLAETQPPKLSVNAEWRPGYWQWVDATWVWLAGMWRVPEADIVAEQTTTAPAAPPPIKVEAPPTQPVHTAVWTEGFWQWSGTTWIWIPGSWQLRPSARVTWRAATWEPRGSVHILVPGAWVRIGGGR